MNYVVSYLVYQPMNKEIEKIKIYNEGTSIEKRIEYLIDASEANHSTIREDKLYEFLGILTDKLNELIEVVNSLIKDEEETKPKGKTK